MSIQIVTDDITKMKVDVIVNAAKKSLLGGGGVDGAIHRAAGHDLLRECYTLGGCETGNAKCTGSYNLQRFGIKAIIHTVGPIYSGNDKDAALLKNCYINSLNLAKQNGFQSIAFPSISTGSYGYPIEKAVPIALEAMREWLENNRENPIEIFVCCFDDLTFSVYRQHMGEVQ